MHCDEGPGDSGIYHRSFPYYHIGDDKQRYWSKINESALFVSDLILNSSVTTDEVSSYCASSFHEIMLILRILEDLFGLVSSRSSFLCSSGHSALEGLLASCYGYKDIVSIEMTEPSAETGKNLISLLASARKTAGNEQNHVYIQVIAGSFLDHFTSQADVVLFDSTSFCCFPSVSFLCESTVSFSMIDEGYLVALFLKVCIGLTSGSYVIIFTSKKSLLSLNEQALEKMEFSSYLKCVYQKDDEDFPPNRNGSEQCIIEKSYWILKKL
jgi:hypothetical protein